jgi:hypothetical protein
MAGAEEFLAQALGAGVARVEAAAQQAHRMAAEAEAEALVVGDQIPESPRLP